MKKYIIAFSLIFTFSLSADGHSNVKPGEETGEFHYFNVTNPAKFVEAMDKNDEFIRANKFCWFNNS
ncbi:hypothetical protein N8705_00105 [Gammaproteobacteria bacterium]|nr:hypothetical protein [Gammaproteobacteria bacterium]